MLNEKLNTVIEGMNVNDLIMLHNEYCRNINDYDSQIYHINDLEEDLYGCDIYRIIKIVQNGKFNINNAKWYTYDGYGNLKSFAEEWEIEKEIYISEIINYIIENNDSLYNDEIQDLLVEYEGEV